MSFYPPSNATTSSGLDAAKPAASSSNVNYTYFSTDINGGTTYISNGVSWVKSAASVNADTGIPSTTWAARGSAATLGSGYVQRVTDIGNNPNVLIVSDGANWCPLNGIQRLYTTTTPIAGATPGTASDTATIPSWTVPGGLMGSTFALSINLEAHASATPIAATPALTFGGADIFSAMGAFRRLLLKRTIRNKTTTTQHIVEKAIDSGARVIVDNDGQDKTKDTTGDLILAGTVNFTHASVISTTIDNYYVDWIL